MVFDDATGLWVVEEQGSEAGGSPLPKRDRW